MPPELNFLSTLVVENERHWLIPGDGFIGVNVDSGILFIHNVDGQAINVEAHAIWGLRTPWVSSIGSLIVGAKRRKSTVID